MGAAIGTIPYFASYQPGALPIASTVYLEIVDSLNATTAQSFNMSQVDLVGKAPSIMAYQMPQATDAIAYFKRSTGLPRTCNIGDIGGTFGNLPSAGATGTFLEKNSGTSYDASWTSVVNGPFGVIGTATFTGALKINGTAYLGTTFTNRFREVISANRTYYIRTTGNDANDGLTPATAFLTSQKAVDTLLSIDRNSCSIFLNFGAGAWDDGFGAPLIISSTVGEDYSNVHVDGAGSALTSISLWTGFTANVTISSISLDCSVTGIGLVVGEHSEVIIEDDVAFIGSGGGNIDIFAYDYAAISFNTTTYTVSGNKARHFTGGSYARLAHLKSVNIVYSGTPTYADGFYYLRDYMFVANTNHGSFTPTHSGAVNGPQFFMDRLAFIEDFSASALNGTPGIRGGSVIGAITTNGTSFGVIGTSLMTGAVGIVGTAIVTGSIFISNNCVVGAAAISSAATDGFLYLPTTNGTPTGTPTTLTGRAPMVIDSTNNRLYFYSSGAWRNAGP